MSFWDRASRGKADECWEWLGVRRNGYGRYWDGSRMVQAHRHAYEALVSPIPDGLVIDHLCRNRACVNPAHMEPVTPRENTLRGESPSAKAARKTHCYKGHPFSPDNTSIKPTGERRCLTCHRERERGRREAVAA